MRYIKSLFVAVLVIAGLLLTGCQKASDAHQVEHPAEVVKIEGTDLSKVTLTEKAVERLDLQTDQVREMNVGGSMTLHKVVPYSSLIYDPMGQTWIYTSPEPRSFVRHKVDVDFIEGNLVVLKEGPPTGTVVATVGTAELYGAEFKVGH